MTVSLVQNFYKQTVTTPWTTGTGNFYVSQKPSVTSGFLVISPNSESLREIVSFSAVGTDGGGDYVTVSARGLGGTTEQAHAVGEKVYMNITAQHIEQIKQAIEDINNSGALNASTTVKGVTRLTTSPNVSLGNPTITIASPAVVTLTAHGLTENDEVQFTTTDTLPTGISPATTYYVISTGLTANTFQLSATFGGAAVNTSGSQAGTHTLTRVTPRALGENDPKTRVNGVEPEYILDTGAANAYVITPSPAITAYAQGQIFTIKAANTNTTASTLNVNGLGVKSIVKSVSSALTGGEITVGGVFTVVYDGTNFQHISLAPANNLQVFNSNSTWNKPAGISFVEVVCIGGGGGGGGGRGGAAASDRGGGGGGGGASVTRCIFPASVLGASVAITVGAAGTSGAGGSSAVGSNGGAGGTSSFGTHLKAFGGGGGGGGGSATATGGGGGGTAGVGGNAGASTSTGGSPQTVAGAAGIAGQGAGSPATNANGNSAEWGGGAGASGSTGGNPSYSGGSSLFGGAGGGSGGKVSSDNVPDAGNAGGNSQSYTAGGGAAGGSGANGSNGVLGNGFAGTGGGGGGGNAGGTGYAGGTGGVGAGGGGGGGGTPVGGAGGAGGVGEVRVYCW